MIKKLNLSDEKVINDILTLQKVSYMIEADLIGFYDIPPLKDTVDSLKECGETFYGYYFNDVLAGIISYKIKANILDIHRVSVHPSYFRKGIAHSLLHFVEDVHNHVNQLVVSTGKANIPAVSLYLKNGFEIKNDIEVQKNVWITEFQKNI